MLKSVLKPMFSVLNIVIITGLIVVVSSLHTSVKSLQSIQKDNRHLAEAEQIANYYFQQGQSVSVSVIRETLVAVDKYLPRYFPHGPFTSRDFIALAMTESDFDQYEVGTSGEKGIFQIMPFHFKSLGIKRDEFDIDVNTEACMMVLKDSYDSFKEYQKTIMAYNGVVVKKNGKWSEKYWKRFTKLRRLVDDIEENLNQRYAK